MSSKSTEVTRGPGIERPRERLLSRGPDALSDTELLALVLRCAGGDAIALATALLTRFGTLTGVLSAPPVKLLGERGLGPTGAAALTAIPALVERALRSELSRAVVFGAAADVGRFLRLRLGGREREVFAALFLDSQHRLIEFRELFLGTLDSATVHPREVLRAALDVNAAAVILAHNHPSGVAEPSRADIALTERIRSVLALVDIRLLDHLVVVPGLAVSFAERGLL